MVGIAQNPGYQPKDIVMYNRKPDEKDVQNKALLCQPMVMAKLSPNDIKDGIKVGTEIIGGLIILDNGIKDLTGVSFRDVVNVTKEWIKGLIHKPKAETPQQLELPGVIQEAPTENIPEGALSEVVA